MVLIIAAVKIVFYAAEYMMFWLINRNTFLSCGDSQVFFSGAKFIDSSVLNIKSLGGVFLLQTKWKKP